MPRTHATIWGAPNTSTRPPAAAAAQPHDTLLNQAATPITITPMTAMGARIVRRLDWKFIAPVEKGPPPAACAKSGQKVPEGFYNIQVMLGRVLRNKGQVGVCATCMEARGITESELLEGTSKSTLAELTTWTQWADKVIVF